MNALEGFNPERIGRQFGWHPPIRTEVLLLVFAILAECLVSYRLWRGAKRYSPKLIVAFTGSPSLTPSTIHHRRVCHLLTNPKKERKKKRVMRPYCTNCKENKSLSECDHVTPCTACLNSGKEETCTYDPQACHKRGFDPPQCKDVPGADLSSLPSSTFFSSASSCSYPQKGNNRD